jgi:hypothetical protein
MEDERDHFAILPILFPHQAKTRKYERENVKMRKRNEIILRFHFLEI